MEIEWVYDMRPMCFNWRVEDTICDLLTHTPVAVDSPRSKIKGDLNRPPGF